MRRLGRGLMATFKIRSRISFHANFFAEKKVSRRNRYNATAIPSRNCESSLLL